MQKHSALWPKRFCFICFVCLFTGFTINMLNSFLAKYIYTIYGNASFSGLLNGTFAVFAILARILAGNLSDKLGRQKILIFGCCLFAVAILIFGIFSFPALLILSHGLQDFGYSAATTADLPPNPTSCQRAASMKVSDISGWVTQSLWLSARPWHRRLSEVVQMEPI